MLTAVLDIAKLQPIADRVIDQTFSTGLANLAEHDRVFFVLWSYSGMVDSGGFPAFFYNSPADYYPDTVCALRQLDLDDHAQLLDKAAAILFHSDVPATLEARNAAIDQVGEAAGTDEEFEALYCAFVDRGGADRVLQILQDWYFSQST
jgi:hypothetical protein